MDQRNLTLAQQAAEREARALRDNKMREAERQKVIEMENAQNKLEREKAKQKEAEEDFVLMQRYAEKLDREAKEREEVGVWAYGYVCMYVCVVRYVYGMCMDMLDVFCVYKCVCMCAYVICVCMCMDVCTPSSS
ncbi:hypothetical protein EON65_40025 [archaeon]|nr:MAG: hypothetical protein EON65_40025 [archaeon]